MITPIDFSQERESFILELASTRAELEALQAQLKSFDLKPLELLLHELLDLEQGTLPGKVRSKTPKTLRKTRSPNGAKNRRRQIKVTCRALGAEAESFGTSDICRQLDRQGLDVTPSLKSYVSSTMRGLVDDGFVQKLERGKWALASTDSDAPTSTPPQRR